MWSLLPRTNKKKCNFQSEELEREGESLFSKKNFLKSFIGLPFFEEEKFCVLFIYFYQKRKKRKSEGRKGADWKIVET